MRKILIDCTETYLTGANTGIHRVVRNIISRRRTMEKYLDCIVVPVVAKSGRFIAPDEDEKLIDHQQFRKLLLDYGKRNFQRIEKSLAKIQRIFSKSEALSNDAEKKPDVLIKTRRIARRLTYSLLSVHQYLTVNDNSTVSVNKGDVILMPDAFWGADDILYSCDYAKKKGAVVVPILHDLIPLTHGQYCNQAFVLDFKKTLPILIEKTDAILTVSKTVKASVEKWLEDNYPNKRIPIDYFYSGSDLGVSAMKDDLNVREEIKQLTERHDVFLMVGTIEPRKGHADVLESFDEIWTAGGNGCLCIIGNVGWDVDELMHRLRAHNQLGRNLFVYHDANDTELRLLYSKVRSLIFSSYVEGFGLPLVEAISHGLPVIARDMDIFHEIGGDWPCYFSNHTELIRQINVVLSNMSPRTNINNNEIPALKSWDQAVIDMSLTLKAILKHMPKSKGSKQ